MKNALVAGATGLIGEQLLKLLIEAPEYNKVYVIARRALSVDHPKLMLLKSEMTDMNDFFVDECIHDVFIALGTTIRKTGSREAFRQVDFDLVLSVAWWGQMKKAEKILVVSSVGANAGASNFYLRTKGEMENAIRLCGIPGIYIFRPSLLTGLRREFRWGEKVGALMMPLLVPVLNGPWRKYRAIAAAQVAHAMYHTAQTSGGHTHVLESDEIALL